MKANNVSAQELEEGKDLRLDFDKLNTIVSHSTGVIPVAVQNAKTKEVILIAYTNKEALEKSMKTGIATFWSVSADWRTCWKPRARSNRANRSSYAHC